MPIKEIRNRILPLCLLLMLGILQGCVNDDLSDCGVSVQFRYVKNVDGTDKFGTAVNRITLFAFDGEGTFVGKYADDVSNLAGEHTMNVPLSSGSYQLVAWGNLCDDYELPEFILGKTNISDAMLSLKNLDGTVAEHPTHLFYGEITNMELQAPYTGRKHVLMDMMKNTNTIYVKATGLPVENDTKAESVWGKEFSCAITSVNGDYKFDNSITGGRLTYIPEYSTSNEGTLDSDFVIMRELNDGSTGSRLTFTHRYDSGVEETLLDTDLVSLLLPASVTGDLDIDDEFTIELMFDYTGGHVTIKINDWEYKESINGI